MSVWWARRGEPVVVNTDYYNHKAGDQDVTAQYVLASGTGSSLDPGPEDLVVLLRDSKGVAIPMKYLDYVETGV